MEDFVTYEQALALKQLGFNEKCLFYYGPDKILYPNYTFSADTLRTTDLYRCCNDSSENNYPIDAPTLAQAQKWLRKNKKHSVEAQYSHDDKYDYCIKKINGLWSDSDKEYDSYEEALSAGITEILLSFEE